LERIKLLLSAKSNGVAYRNSVSNSRKLNFATDKKVTISATTKS